MPPSGTSNERSLTAVKSPKDHENPSQTVLPHNLQTEMAVLGAILFDNNAQQRVSDILKARDFYAPANSAIFEVLDRLMSWAIFAQTDTVMSKDIERLHFHQRTEANRAAHIVAKSEERGAVRTDDPAVKR